MKTLLGSLSALVVLFWGWDFINAVAPAAAHPFWIARQEALYLSGLLSIAMMSAAMFLATRPTWLEQPLGGMDRIYRTHKWAGILAVSFAALHWLIEMSGDILKSAIGREGRLPKEKFAGFLEILRDLAEISRVIYTAPPGAINTSNTASAIMVALDSLGGFAVSGIPLPALTLIKEGAKYSKNRALKARIAEALKPVQ